MVGNGVNCSSRYLVIFALFHPKPLLSYNFDPTIRSVSVFSENLKKLGRLIRQKTACKGVARMLRDWSTVCMAALVAAERDQDKQK